MLLFLSLLALFVSAATDALNQLAILERGYRTWLENIWPNFFTWDTGIFEFNAWKTYQAMGIGLAFVSGTFTPLMFVSGVLTTMAISPFWLIAYWVGFYQVRNLFMHVIWIKPGYRDWRPVFYVG